MTTAQDMASVSEDCLARIAEYMDGETRRTTRKDIETYNQFMEEIIKTPYTMAQLPRTRAIMVTYSQLHVALTVARSNQTRVEAALPSVRVLTDIQHGQRYSTGDIDNLMYAVCTYIGFDIQPETSQINDEREIKEEMHDFMYAFLLELCVRKHIDIYMRNNKIKPLQATGLCGHNIGAEGVLRLTRALRLSTDVHVIYQEIFIRLLPENFEWAHEEDYTGSTWYKRGWQQGSKKHELYMSMTAQPAIEKKMRADASIIAFVIALCQILVPGHTFLIHINRRMFNCTNATLFITRFGHKGIYNNGTWFTIDNAWDLALVYTKAVCNSLSDAFVDGREQLKELVKILSGRFLPGEPWRNSQMRTISEHVWAEINRTGFDE